MKIFRYALRQTTPILFSYFFVGVAYGVLMVEAGFSPLYTAAASLFVYAGSMQIVMIGLLTAGTPLITVAVMTFFVNARHIFYGVGFVERFRPMGRRAPYMALTLTDEAYSVLCSVSYPEGMDGGRVDFLICAIAHAFWVCSATAGALLGQALPVDLAGIEFSATAFFITVCVNQWRQLPSRIPAITGLCSALVFYVLLGPEGFLLPALSLSLVALLVMKELIAPRLRKEWQE